jgi:hypothetical protein
MKIKEALLLTTTLLMPMAAKAEQIDDILRRIQSEQDARTRAEMAFQQATPIASVSLPTVWNLQGSIPPGESALSSNAVKSLVWHNVHIGSAKKDASPAGRRRAIGIVIRNNGIHIAEDGPNIKLEQFWMTASSNANLSGDPVRIKSLENKQVELDSLPFKSMFSSLMGSLESNLNVIADFYGTYDLRPTETRVYYLPEKQYVDYVQVKAITLDNTPNYSGKLDIRVLFE